MPVLFSMSHPLDEIAPVICRTGGMYANCLLLLVGEIFIDITGDILHSIT